MSWSEIQPGLNWIRDISNCHLGCVTSQMSFSVTSLQISVIQFWSVTSELHTPLSFCVIKTIHTSQNYVVDIYNVYSGQSALPLNVETPQTSARSFWILVAFSRYSDSCDCCVHPPNMDAVFLWEQQHPRSCQTCSHVCPSSFHMGELHPCPLTDSCVCAHCS